MYIQTASDVDNMIFVRERKKYYHRIIYTYIKTVSYICVINNKANKNAVNDR